MISFVTSYLWGSEEEECNVPTTLAINDQMEENDWILIRPKDYYDGPAGESSPSETEDTWLVTPPQCFGAKKSGNEEINPIENRLIEHPSMSIYHGNEENQEETKTDQPDQAMTKQEKQKNGRLQLQKRIPLKDINVKLIERKNASPKNLKRKNMVHVRTHTSRKNKQYGRQSGKHTALVGKRAS